MGDEVISYLFDSVCLLVIYEYASEDKTEVNSNKFDGRLVSLQH